METMTEWLDKTGAERGWSDKDKLALVIRAVEAHGAAIPFVRGWLKGHAEKERVEERAR